MKKILVTGAAGFIGSHLVEALLNLDYCVIGIDNFSNGKHQNIEYLTKLPTANNFTFIEGDLRDVNFCEKVCTDIDVIYHQAALGSVPRSINEPQLYFDNNLGGMLNLMESARKSNVKRFIFASSSSVYGDTAILPKIETMPLNPKSPYAVSKAAGEHYLSVYQSVYGLETIGFRYFNVFGPRQDPNSQYAAITTKKTKLLRFTPNTSNIFGSLIIPTENNTKEMLHPQNIILINRCINFLTSSFFRLIQ